VGIKGLISIRAVVLAIALAASPAGVLAATPCDLAFEALRTSFPGGSDRMVLDGMGNLQRVGFLLREAGPCLSRAYADRPDDRCGWVDPNNPTAHVHPPARETVEALQRAPARDAAKACPALVQQARLVLGWRAPTSRPNRLRRDGLYEHTSVGVTLPVVNAARGEAIAWVESQVGPLGGGGGFILMRTDARGRWQMAARFPGYVS
jgi:hypothetical protein